MENNIAIKVDNLKIIYDEKTDNELLVLNNFSYTFMKNKIYCIIGNSGSGKTSLIMHLNGLLRSKYGNITIGNTFFIRQNKKKIKKINQLHQKISIVMQFAEYQLFNETVIKDIMFGVRNLHVPNIGEKEILHCLDLIKLNKKYLNSSPYNLSGGQKRRVAIGSALIINPEILMLDDPMIGLDPQGESDIINIIKDLKDEGKTIIISLNNLDHVLEVADEVLILNDKKILAEGDPYIILNDEKILEKINMEKPKILSIAYGLSKNKKFKNIIDNKPKNINELISCIRENE